MADFVTSCFRDSDLAGVKHKHWRVRIPIKTVDIGNATATTVERHIFGDNRPNAPFCIGSTGVSKVVNGRCNGCYVDLEWSKVLCNPLERPFNNRQFRCAEVRSVCIRAIRGRIDGRSVVPGCTAGHMTIKVQVNGMVGARQTAEGRYI